MPEASEDMVDRLFQMHLADELRSCTGNLAAVMDIVGKGWLPPADAPEYREHLDALRKHMAQVGHPEDDDFLLRYALTVPGRRRGIVPPLIVLSEGRGGLSARRLEEAEGQIVRLREALAVGRELVPGLSTDTRQAIAQLAEIAGAMDRGGASSLRAFQALTPAQAADLAGRAVGLLDSKAENVFEIGTRILQELACFRMLPLDEALCASLVERGIFWPASIYRDAGGTVARKLAALIEETSDTLELDHRLLSLAWTRSDEAHRQFRRWARQAPEWAALLHIPPADYLPDAGWCLDKKGVRKDLVSLQCHRLRLTKGKGKHSIKCRAAVKKRRCPACGGPLAHLFDFSGVTASLFQGILADAPRKVLCCLHCACYAPTFASYADDGEAEWLSPHEACAFEFGGTPDECLREMEEERCPPFACAVEFALDDASTLGGVPMWVQYAAYPHCIRCGQVMTFLAQHDNGPLLTEVGVYYAFFCAACRVSAVGYQQT